MAQTDALAKLLQDNDPETVRLVRDQLKAGGEEGVFNLQTLIRTGNPHVAKTALSILEEIHRELAEDDFELFCRFFPEHGDLEAACWALAQAITPGVDFTSHQLMVNSWGRRFLSRSAGASSNSERVKMLCAFMSDELDLRGNSQDYYNMHNSLLPSVIESRRGIPITLTALFMFVAQRAGMSVAGINLPGHFIAQHGEILFDPFHGGRILDRSDCERILDCQKIPIREEYFLPATSREILMRMLVNLFYIYDLQRNDSCRGKVRCWLDALKRD